MLTLIAHELRLGEVMETPHADRRARKVLEDEWHQRLIDAKARLDLARSKMNDIARDPKADLAPSDGMYQFRKGLHEENLALEEYYRVLCVFSELVLYGTVPGDADGKKQFKHDPPESSA